ncbi:hypothetical protein [Nocardia nova]|uniref:hypothetical protein n=1 Tax=Nocardia nova TaxID=37330 RepID=UPI0033F36D2A
MTGANADPVDEGGQAVKAGFLQAMQTAAMTSNLMQRGGAESRSRKEFAQRQADRGIEHQRKSELHARQIQGYIDRAEHGRLEHHADMWIKAGKYREHLREMQIKDARLQHDQDRAERAKTSDEASERRREKLHDLNVRSARGEYNRKGALHTRQLRRYDNQIAQDRHLHALKVENQKLLNDARRRSLGLTETLTDTDPGTAHVHAAAAGWAAAEATADLSDSHRTDAEAWRERYAEDTGEDPRLVTDAEPDATVDMNDPVNQLAVDNTLIAHADSALRDLDTDRATGTTTAATPGEDEVLDVLDGEVIDVVVEATGVTGHLHEHLDFGADLPPVQALEAGPSVEVAP